MYGDETFLLDRALTLLRRRLLPSGSPGTWRNVWADEPDARIADALANLTSPSLFGGREVLVIRRADALRDAEQDRIMTLLPGLGATGTLILVARAADQRRRLFAACVRAGAAFACSPLAEVRAAAPWIVRLARERGHDITAPAVQELLERSGTELGVLSSEIEKLSLHVGEGGRIGPEHVRVVVGSIRGHAVQELTDRLARGDVAGVVAVLRQLLAEGEPPVRLLAFLAGNVRRALHVAELTEQGIGDDAIAARLSMPPWLVSRVRSRMSAAHLVRALWRLRQLDQDLKSTRPTDVVFERALVEIAQAAASPGGARPVSLPGAG